jgi:hypothetical protein
MAKKQPGTKGWTAPGTIKAPIKKVTPPKRPK